MYSCYHQLNIRAFDPEILSDDKTMLTFVLTTSYRTG